MVITWYGLSSFKIVSGTSTLITDPFAKTAGPTPPRGTADAVISSNLNVPTYNNTEPVSREGTFIINGPGEFDVKGLFVRGIAAAGDPAQKTDGFDHTTIYNIRMEDLRLGFLGSLKQKELTDAQLEAMGDIDILFVPAGGNTVCDAEQAVAITNQLEPKYVIPMHYAQAGIKIKLDKLEVFLKEIGQAKKSPQDKLTTKKSALPEGDTTEVVVLDPQR
jgi:L-ascorbate metabolism protein UlaG (beta-lactamase superfamily)